jgi:hypothetical protein
MLRLISNPFFQLVTGAVISFGGSVVANYLFYGRMEKSRAEREVKRAYNRLTTRLIHTTITDLDHPLHLLPVEIADRMEDLKFALEDFNPKFDYMKQAQGAINQAVDLRKKQQDKYPPSAISTTV